MKENRKWLVAACVVFLLMVSAWSLYTVFYRLSMSSLQTTRISTVIPTPVLSPQEQVAYKYYVHVVPQGKLTSIAITLGSADNGKRYSVPVGSDISVFWHEGEHHTRIAVTREKGIVERPPVTYFDYLGKHIPMPQTGFMNDIGRFNAIESGDAIIWVLR